MLTKQRVADCALIASTIAVLLWPSHAIHITAGFLLTTFGMLAIDRPKGEMFPAQDLDEPISNALYWKLQPRWVKAFTMWIGVPAWLLLAGQVGMGSPFAMEPILIGAFVATAALQMIFVARSYWRMEI